MNLPGQLYKWRRLTLFQILVFIWTIPTVFILLSSFLLGVGSDIYVNLLGSGSVSQYGNMTLASLLYFLTPSLLPILATLFALKNGGNGKPFRVLRKIGMFLLIAAGIFWIVGVTYGTVGSWLAHEEFHNAGTYVLVAFGFYTLMLGFFFNYLTWGIRVFFTKVLKSGAAS